METVKPAVYSHDLVEAGIDWITATRPAGDEAYQFEQAAEDMLSEQREEGGAVFKGTHPPNPRRGALFPERPSETTPGGEVKACSWGHATRTQSLSPAPM
jgi:hypothetical protein